MLVGNKSDLKEAGKGVSKEQVNAHLQRHPRWTYLECSAKLNWNVKPIFERLGGLMRETEKEREKQVHSSKMKIHPSKLRKGGDSSSCC
jgi:GTPase SAR1 family protein